MNKEQLELENKTGNVIIKFGAEWCGPCKIVDKVLENLTDEINVVKIDVEKQKELASEYEVRNLPTLFYYKDGQQISKTVGATSVVKIYDIFS